MEIKIWSNHQESVPTIYIHSFVGNGEDVWNACQAMGCPPFNLVSIHKGNFDDELSPWPAEGVWKGQAPFGGKAEEHLKEVIDEVLPKVESELPAPSRYVAMVGYSLAGLFTLWSTYHTDRFKRIGCVSSSFWYPSFIPFIKKNQMKRQPDCIYFSLGDKESKSKHPLMKQVNERTQEVVNWIRETGIPTVFEMNPGNHFTEPEVRTAKAIKWLLEQE